MTYTRAIAEQHMRRIRARLVFGWSDAEREAALAEQATFYRRQPDLFTAPPSRDLLPGDKVSPTPGGCGSPFGPLELIDVQAL